MLKTTAAAPAANEAAAIMPDNLGSVPMHPSPQARESSLTRLERGVVIGTTQIVNGTTLFTNGTTPDVLVCTCYLRPSARLSADVTTSAPQFSNLI
jgi:hypothetical protein